MADQNLVTESGYYEKIRQNLAVGPLIAPKHEKVIQLLKVFWNEDLARVLSYFPPVGKEISLEELVEKTGMEKREIKKLLKKAVQKKTLVKSKKAYGLAPLIPGIFEAYFIARQDSEENIKKAAELYRYMFKNHNEFSPSIIKKDFEMFRPLLPIESKEKLIEINENVKNESQVLPYELVEDLINNNEAFAIIQCQCRLIGEINGEPCKLAPSEMGCFVTGKGATALANYGWGKALNKQEAIDYLKKTEKAGLVHCTSNSKGGEHLTFICNCCPCHCGALHPVKNSDYKTIIPSNFRPEIDQETCVECETCMKKCPMEVIYHEGSKMVIDLSNCIGCGICASNCAKNAIKMNKVSNIIPPDMKKIGNKVFMQHLGELLI